jgi:triosephosphate isomerase
VAAALAAGLVPVVCVGESESEREDNKTFSVIERQLAKALEGIDRLERIVVAYEPIWAIGTGKTATSEQAQEVHAFIRKQMEGLGGNSIAKHMRILYGGSVKPDNVAGLISMEDIDGALVGGASLDAEVFSGIVRPCSGRS